MDEQTAPYGFSWVEEPLLAASAMPGGEGELRWLRGQGIDIVVTLTEYSIPRKWVDDAGLMNVHIPVTDFSVPDDEGIEKWLATVRKAKENGMGVLVHCLAGKGRTGTALALYLASTGMRGDAAVDRVRSLRPGSIETDEQRRLVVEFAKRLGN